MKIVPFFIPLEASLKPINGDENSSISRQRVSLRWGLEGRGHKNPFANQKQIIGSPDYRIH